ncbi:hypothetical protein PYW08_010019 [Mythimna loreyi]|uniref:Uncharacterized protein n=2 Tax=Mythimna loreyi TaxID=667449 RepID=A0ACC2Q724_9NEOP|nr:hypothetical protein PYW08_010018 [Mythimna loreyi]KAJ8708637.1 hypothetical protein PYW08_010019 [Mythimna loreyi]
MRISLLQEEGKLENTSTVAEVDVFQPSLRLCIIDRNSKEKFLVDTGADISVLAARNKKYFKPAESTYNLFAANGTQIRTYGERTLELNLGLRRSFKWTFVVADVKTSILGADFLANHKLLVDLHHKKLIDRVTDLSVNAITTQATEEAVYIIDRNHAYHNILKQYPDVLRPMSTKSPAKHDVKHRIETTGQPIYSRPRPLPPDKYKAAKLEFEKMMEMGICKPSKSPWASPLHVVKKKDGSLRVCGDYRRLNAVTVPDRYPIPRMQDFTYQLHGKKVFSKLDMKMAYYSIPIHEEDAAKTAIITPFGLFEFNCMTFGLRNSGQTFQRFMHEVLRGLDDIVFCFVDDLLVYSNNEEEHQRHLHQVLERLNNYGVTLNIDKCEFGTNKIQFLGYEVTQEGIKPTQDRIQAIVNYPKPNTIQELRRFLGMINFYRSCLPHQAEHQNLLNKYLHNSKKNDKSPIPWTPEAEKAFEHCRQSILKATTLTHPIPNAPLCLFTDASDTSIGAVLQQKVDNIWKPLAFYSKTMSDTQRRYSVYDRELLAMYTAVQHLRRLIEGNDLTIYTDHKPLTYALSRPPSSSDTPRRERQLHYISQFCTNIKYINGHMNSAADALSRIEEVELQNSTIDYNQLVQEYDNDSELQSCLNNPKLKFTRLTMPGVQRPILCETSTANVRPYLPPTYRFAAFKAQHDLCHPGVRTSRKIITNKFFWPSMNKDVATWARACIGCQRAKVHRHVKSPLGQFQESARFEHIHVDIVGELPPSNDYRYLVTIIDRCTKWLEAIPARDITAETVARAVYDGWISRFGCPLRITTDQGRQFESALFTSLMKKFGVTRIRTTPYHPQANGQVERAHKTLKSALMARAAATRWSEELPTVLLGLRTALRENTSFSPAQMTYGTTLRIPSDFFVPTTPNIEDAEFVRQLTETMSSLSPVRRTHTSNANTFVYKDLATCTHAFLRNDTVRRPLTPPYDGPYEILRRSEDGKQFTLQLPRRTIIVSVDRLKPAHLYNEDATKTQPSVTSRLPTPASRSTTQDQQNVPACKHTYDAPTSIPTSHKHTYVTRTGRTVKPNVRFA